MMTGVGTGIDVVCVRCEDETAVGESDETARPDSEYCVSWMCSMRRRGEGININKGGRGNECECDGCDNVRYALFQVLYIGPWVMAMGHDTPNFWNIVSSVLNATGLTRLTEQNELTSDGVYREMLLTIRLPPPRTLDACLQERTCQSRLICM